MPSSTPGSRLKEARLKLGLTQAGVARLVNQSTHTYQDWERDKSRPRSLRVTVKLCSILHITIDHYLNDTPNTTEELTLLQEYRTLTPAGQSAIRTIMSEMRKSTAQTESE